MQIYIYLLMLTSVSVCVSACVRVLICVRGQDFALLSLVLRHFQHRLCILRIALCLLSAVPYAPLLAQLPCAWPRFSTQLSFNLRVVALFKILSAEPQTDFSVCCPYCGTHQAAIWT